MSNNSFLNKIGSNTLMVQGVSATAISIVAEAADKEQDGTE